jgi:hypothetical protein
MGVTLTQTREETIERGRRLVEAGREGGASIRLLGGVAVAVVCPSANELPALRREFSDLDVVTSKDARRSLPELMSGLGYIAAERFNAAHGHSRMLFGDEASGLHVDVFIEEFRMCHRLDLSSRLSLSEDALNPSDLLLTKAQVAKLTMKDVTDLVALLIDHPVGEGEESTIDAGYVTRLLGSDWGWWKTVTDNLNWLESMVREFELPVAARQRFDKQLERLRAAIDSADKSRRWRARARLGTRVSWREEPEERN